MPERENRKIRTVMIVLAVLLAISLLSLAGIALYRQFGGAASVSGTAPNNVITPGEKASGTGCPQAGSAGVVLLSGSGRTAGTAAAVPLAAAGTDSADVTLSLYARHAEDNTPFQAANMFPGDSETKYYCVQVSHLGNVTLRFRADIRPGYEKLAEVLKCRVVLPDSGTVLYDGLLRDMPASLNVALSASEGNTSEVSYEISAYLDTSVGNEYMDKPLIADFRWWVEETGALEPSPKTGDEAHPLLWTVLAAGSLCLLLLLLGKRRKEDAADET